MSSVYTPGHTGATSLWTAQRGGSLQHIIEIAFTLVSLRCLSGRPAEAAVWNTRTALHIACQLVISLSSSRQPPRADTCTASEPSTARILQLPQFVGNTSLSRTEPFARPRGPSRGGCLTALSCAGRLVMFAC